MAKYITLLAWLLATNFAPVRAVWCTFYSDDQCRNRVGAVNYDASNGKCFTNSGSYVKCDVPLSFNLVQYEQGQCGTDPKGLFGFQGGDCTNISGVSQKGYQYKLEPIGKPKTKRKDSTTCTAQVDFYYGGKCIGPAARYEDQVQEPVAPELEWRSPYKNDGLFGMYIASTSDCAMLKYEGENCNGNVHNVGTKNLKHSCNSINNGIWQMRSWQWQCRRGGCNDETGA